MKVGDLRSQVLQGRTVIYILKTLHFPGTASLVLKIAVKIVASRSMMLILTARPGIDANRPASRLFRCRLDLCNIVKFKLSTEQQSVFHSRSWYSVITSYSSTTRNRALGDANRGDHSTKTKRSKLTTFSGGGKCKTAVTTSITMRGKSS